MRFGYFDDKNREYVIDRPDTPAPWANYLGSPEYGAIIFNGFDQPGRYLYLRDNESKDYWSASWQPVGKDLTVYKSECRHGLSYTKMIADYSDIHSEALYYVPLDKTYEVWNLTITNHSKTKRNLSITG